MPATRGTAPRQSLRGRKKPEQGRGILPQYRRICEAAAPVGREAASPELLGKVKLVVMCLDQQDTRLAEACLQSGTHYVDVSASGDFLTMLQRLDPVKHKLKAAAVLSVGLAPGLTNLLAAQAVQELDHTEQIDISIMLGLGDSHGQAAMEWTVDNLGADFEITEHGRPRTASSFTEAKAADFGFALRTHRAYRFPFRIR